MFNFLIVGIKVAVFARQMFLKLFMTALADKNLLGHVFQNSFSDWKGMEGGIAA